MEKMAKERGIDMKAMESELIKTLRPSSLIKRMATPEEVANLRGLSISQVLGLGGEEVSGEASAAEPGAQAAARCG